MKAKTFFLPTMLLMFNALGSMFNELRAQDENAAFYIYQNDGHFDGFFYDEVLKMSYSKIDTAGIEYDVFVTQEIVTADSTYRIMLSAIDSVSFVQPEIIFNPRLIVMEDVGMLKYSQGHNGQVLVFKDLPEDLMPKEGDVLVTFNFYNMYFPDGFGGKVTRIMKQGSLHFIYTDPLSDFGDIYQQFITVEDFGYNPEARRLTPRRTAGLKDVRRYADIEETTLFKFSGTPHASWVYGNFTASADLNIGIECRAKAVYNFSFFGEKYFKVDLKQKVETGLSATFDIQANTPWAAETKWGSVLPTYLPTAAPILKILLMPEGFIRSQIHATAQAKTRTLTFRSGMTIEFKDWSFGGSRMFFGNEAKFDDDDEEEDPGPLIQLTGSINGFVQAGMKWPFVIRTNDFFKKVLDAEVGMNIWAGPKLSGEVNLNLNDLASSIIAGNPTKFYNSFKDTKVSFTPFVIDYELKSLVKYLSYKGDTLTILDGNLGWKDYDWYMLPKFDAPQILPAKPLNYATYYADPSAQFTADDWGANLFVNIKPRRDVLIGTEIGAAIFQGDSLVADWLNVNYHGDHNPIYTNEKYYDQDKKSLTDPDASGPVPFPVDGMANISFCNRNIRPGHYKAYPTVRILGQRIICEPGVEFDLPGMYLDMDQKYEDIQLPGDRESEMEVIIKTNASDIRTNHLLTFVRNVGWSSYDSNDNLIFYPYDLMHRHALCLPDTLKGKVGRNPEMLPRELKYPIEAIGYNDLGKRDTLTQIAVVKQSAFNIYDRISGMFWETMTCNNGPAKGSTINVRRNWGTINTGAATSRSGNVVSCGTVSGSVPYTEASGLVTTDIKYEVSYTCDVEGATIRVGTIQLQWEKENYGNPITCTLRFDIHGFKTESGEPSPVSCSYWGRPSGCTYKEQGKDSEGTWTNTYILSSEKGYTHVDLSPRELEDAQY